MSDENFFSDLVPAEKPAESTGGAGYFDELVPKKSIDVLGGRLAGKEDAFIQAGIKHEIDPKFLMAVSMFETGNGTSHMVRTKNNVAGITDHTGQTYRTFGSIDDSIDYMASNLRRNYLDKGLNTIPAIARKYAPVGATNDPNATNNEWPNAVAANYQKLSSPEIQRRIAEFPAIAGEVTGQAVGEAGKAGETSTGFFSDLVPKKAEAGKAEPPPAQGAEDAGIFADLVPRQPVKIEEPAPAAAGPEPSPAPAPEEELPSLPSIDLGTAAPAAAPAAAGQTSLLASAAEEPQPPPAAAGPPQPAPTVAAGLPSAPPGFAAAQIPSLEPQVVAPPAPEQDVPSYFRAKAGVYAPQAVQMAPGAQVPVVAGAGEGLKETAAGLVPHTVAQFRGLAQIMGAPTDPQGFFMNAVKQGLVDAAVAKKAIEKGPLSREAGYAYGTLIPQFLMMRAGVKAPVGPVLRQQPGIEPPPVQVNVPAASTEIPGAFPGQPPAGGQPITVFRGEAKGPSPAGQAHGVGTYYGLTEDAAQTFSRKGTVKESSLTLENPAVVNSDTELSAIRTEAGVNPADPRTLLSKSEAARFTQYLRSKGHDSFVTNYDQAPGGKQIVVFPKAEPTVAAQTPGFVTSTKNAVVDAERQARGLSPILDEAVQSNQATMAAAEARLAANPDYGRALVADLVAGTKKSIEALDEAVLLREKIKTQNERALAAERSKDPSITDSERALATERFQEAENYISDIDLATYRSGQNWGRMGQFRQRLARDDYSLVTMESRMRIAKGNKPLTPDELATLQRQVKDLEKAQGKRQAKEQRDLEATRERLERRVAQLKGLEPAAIKARRLSVDDLEIEILRTELAKVKERLFEVRRLPKAKERVAKKIQEIEHRIATYGYAERFRREALKPDRELRELQYRVREAQEKLNKGIVEARWKNQGKVQRAAGNLFRFSTLPRALQASADLSYLLRQGKIMLMSRPLTTIRTFGETLKAGFGTRYAESLAEARTKPGGFFGIGNKLGYRRPFQIFNAASKRGYNDIMERIRNDPEYHESKYEGGVSYTDVEPGGKLRNAEEAYQSAWADAIPIVRESQRAYVAFLNKLRLEAYKTLKGTLGNNGEITPIQAKILGNYVNVVTGRGNLNLPMGLNLEAAAVGMGQVFFAPRYRVSRFQYIGGQPLLHGIHLAEGRTAAAMRTRAVIAGEYARAMAGYSVYYSLLYMAARTFGGGQVTIGNDPRSSDFGKVVTGNTRIDPLAGLSQASVFVGRSVSGQTVSSRTGEVHPIRGQVPYGKPTWFDVAARFVRGSLSPNFSAAADLIQGTDFRYRPVTLSSEAVRLITPLSAGDMIDSMKEQGFTAGAALSVLSLLGENVQTYSPRLQQAPRGAPMLVPPPPPPPPPPAPPPPPVPPP